MKVKLGVVGHFSLAVRDPERSARFWSASFDLWLYTKPTGFGPGRKFFVTAVPDAVRPAKASVTWKEGAQPQRLPNTVGAVLDAIA